MRAVTRGGDKTTPALNAEIELTTGSQQPGGGRGGDLYTQKCKRCLIWLLEKEIRLALTACAKFVCTKKTPNVLHTNFR